MGITQGEAARRIGVDQGTLARWERGEREPTGRVAVRAAAFLAGAESASTGADSVVTVAAELHQSGPSGGAIAGYRVFTLGLMYFPEDAVY